MSLNRDLTVEEIASIVFRRSENLKGDEKQKALAEEKKIRDTGVYDRMHVLWRGFCYQYEELGAVSSALSATLRDDGGANNGEKRYVLNALIKHFNLAKSHSKRKAQRAEHS